MNRIVSTDDVVKARRELVGLQLSSEDIERILTAYDELVSNARQHGRAPVVVKAAVWAGRALTLRVKDAGRGFQANRRLRVLRVFPRTMLALQADLVAAGKQDRFRLGLLSVADRVCYNAAGNEALAYFKLQPVWQIKPVR